MFGGKNRAGHVGTERTNETNRVICTRGTTNDEYRRTKRRPWLDTLKPMSKELHLPMLPRYLIESRSCGRGSNQSRLSANEIVMKFVSVVAIRALGMKREKEK